MMVRLRREQVPVLSAVLACCGLIAGLVARICWGGGTPEDMRNAADLYALASALWAGAFLRSILVIRRIDTRPECERDR